MLTSPISPPISNKTLAPISPKFASSVSVYVFFSVVRAIVSVAAV